MRIANINCISIKILCPSYIFSNKLSKAESKSQLESWDTHYGEAQALTVVKNYGCTRVPSDKDYHYETMYYTVSDSQGVLLGTLDFKTKEQGGDSRYPGSCAYIYSGYNLPRRDEYILQSFCLPASWILGHVSDPTGGQPDQEKCFEPNTAYKKDFATEYKPNSTAGVTTIMWYITVTETP